MQATNQKVVSIEYTLKDNQGNVLDTSNGRAPLSYLHGAGNIIPGLEKALDGKSPGETLEVLVPPKDAYGERNAALVMDVPREQFPEETPPQVGQQFQVETPEGARVVTVAKVDDAQVTIDANHPLAGRPLNFDVTVTDVRNATSEELQCGQVQ